MEGFKIYGVSSTIVVSVIAMGLVVFIVFNSILALLLWFLLAAFAFVLISALLPKFYKGMSQTIDLRDNAIHSRKTEIAGLICTECKRAGSLIGSASSDVETESQRGELSRLGQELSSMKCCSSEFEVEPDTLSGVDFTFLTTKSAEVRDRLGAIKRSVADKYMPVLSKRNSEREKALQGLLFSGYRIGELHAKFEGLLARGSTDLEDLVEEEQEMAGLISEIADECILEASAILSQEARRKGVREIAQSLEKLKAEKGGFPDSARKLSEIKGRLNALMEGDFFPVRDALIKSMLSVSRASESPELSELGSKLKEKSDFLKSIEDPGRLGELKGEEKSYRETVASAFEEISGRMKDLRKELSAYSLPRELSVKIPQKLEAPKGSLQEFTKKAVSMLSEAAPALEGLSRNARIMRSYPKVERLIAGRLAETGKALGRDLDVKYPEIFFALYRKNHMGKVKLMQSPEPKLVAM